MRADAPPPDWPQRAGRTLPFPPGDGEDIWEVVIDAPGPGQRVEYQVRSTGEVWRREPGGWRAPTWDALPPVVRRAVRRASS